MPPNTSDGNENGNDDESSQSCQGAKGNASDKGNKSVGQIAPPGSKLKFVDPS